MNGKSKERIKPIFTARPVDAAISAGILTAAFALCFALKRIDASSAGMPIVLILAVFLISCFTQGYICGILCSVIGVLGSNYFFTYPYYEFNFSPSGDPITIISMLAVSIITCALTTRLKNQEQLRIEAETEKMRGNLLRSVSHDLRTPLTSILGATSAIIENDEFISRGERMNLLSEIKNDTQWLIQMVENLLSITKINTDGKARIIKRTEFVEEIVADSLAKFRKRFPNFPVTVTVPDELLAVPMDGILIEQVITNLLENAAIHAKGATMTTFTVHSQPDYAIFEVRDNGSGISKELLPHIFDGHLTHEDEDTVDSRKNMGIGLSVCYTIIKAHGGYMSARNASVGGAVFEFALPREKDTEGDLK